MLYRYARVVGSGGAIPTGPTFSTNRNIVATGDSITRGYAVTTPYGNLVASFFGTTAGVFGHDGTGYLNGGSANLPSYISEVIAAKTSTPQTLIVFAGTNDLANGFTPAASIAAGTTYINDLLSAGYAATRLILPTCLPRGGMSETDRTDFNTRLIALGSTLGCTVLRLDLDSRIGVAGACNNTTYYNADAIHPNDTGQGVIASLIEAVMT